MGLINDIKNEAAKNGSKIQSTNDTKLETVFNNMLYCDKNPKKEVKFIKQMMTRGADSSERIGLHASALIAPENSFCIRQQVLSLLFKQKQGNQYGVGLLRIFEEGNAIHEKWQRLFIRAGYSEPEDLDFTRYKKGFELSFTPDIVCNIPDFGQMVGEIKSVNTYQFKKMTRHASGEKQLKWYMFLTGIHKGFTLCEDKNTQDIKVKYYELNKEDIYEPKSRAEEIKFLKERFLEERKMPKRFKECQDDINCKKAIECPMRDACFNTGTGRIKIGDW